MSPDMRTWVEAAIRMHIQKSVPLEQAPELLVGRVSCGVLLFWRHEVPARFEDLVSDAEFSIIGFKMKDMTIFDKKCV